MGRHSQLIVAILVALGVSGSLLADSQPDETLPGFKANDLLFAGTVDHVSAYSGDTGIVIPLGKSYHLGPGTDWQLKAYNTLKIWWTGDTQCVDVNGGQQDVNQAFVLGYPTLGVGWTLGLGSVGTWGGAYAPNQGPLAYVSPDGAVHRTDLTGVTVDEPRLRVSCQSTTSCQVEFPDGSVGRFSQPLPDPEPLVGSTGTFPDFTPGQIMAVPGGDSPVGLTSLTDAFGNSLLTATYGTNGAPAWGISTITLHPVASPATITFNWKTTTGAQSVATVTGTDWSGATISATWPVLYSIQFPAMSTGAGGEHELIKFTFQTIPFERNFRIDTTTDYLCNPADQKDALVPTMTRIDFSRVTSTGASTVAGNYTMSYPNLQSNGAWYSRGLLGSITLPTGANVSFTLSGGGPWLPCSVFPPTDLESTDTPSGCTTSGLSANVATPVCRICSITGNSGYVKSRKLTVGSLVSTTNYARTTYVPSGYPTQALGKGQLTRVVEVTEPIDASTSRLTRSIFHVPDAASDPSTGGLELERTVSAGTTFADSPLRSVVNCEETVSGSTVNSYCGYMTDLGAVNHFSGGQVRKRGSVTWYGDKPANVSGGSCAQASTGCDSNLATASTWVPNAYAYKSSIHSTANLTSNINRTTTTDWTPCNDASHWVLGIFDYKLVQDSSGSAPTSVRNDYTFEPCKPFPTRVSTTDANSANGTLYADFTDGGAGNPTVIKHHGGGSTGLSSTVFTDSLTFLNGLALTQQRSGVIWKSFDVTRDGTSGLIYQSRDPNGLATSYRYDGLGRLTSIAPPGGELATALAYDSATQTTATRGSGATGTYERYLYDGAGRLSREIRQMPTGYAFRSHAYDIGGHESFTSEWKSCSVPTSDCLTGTASGTTLASFDVFDRPQRITRADGSYTMIDRSDGSAIPYSDTYETSTTYDSVGTVASGPTGTRKDLLGRVTAVQEAPATDSGVAGQRPSTTYGYNVLDKIATVSQGSQARNFSYDAFGFLRSETNPEKSLATYSSYDGLGNLLSKTDGGLGFTNSYDPAGRLTLVNSGATRYVMNCYDGSASGACPDGSANSSGGSHPKGRLTRRIGYNPGVSTTATVTEDFAYSDATGRISAKAITLGGTPFGTLSANESWQYTTLGSLSNFGHAQIGAFPVTFTNQTYSSGLPTTLTTANGTQTVASNVTYAASGALYQWRAGLSGVTTTITPDATGIARPGSIATSGATTGTGCPTLPCDFLSGTISYDGAGDIKAMGSDAFAYDARTRLTTATVLHNAQTYAYDRYGNLNYSTVNPSTNHLSAGTYDLLGNLTGFGGATFGYDALSRQASFSSGSASEKYVYDGAGERIARIPSTGTTWYATFRDVQNRLATEYTITTGGYTKTKDYFFLGHLLVSTYNQSTYSFYSSDHLGTPRLVTNASGAVLERHNYFPYGQEIQGSFGAAPLKFASMERDATSNNDFDHARFHMTGMGRFLGVDKIGGHPIDPHSWNRYTYTLSNPLKHIDPDGLLTILIPGTWAGHSPSFQPGGTFFRAVQQTFHDPQTVALRWSGGDNVTARSYAAAALKSLVRSHPFAPGEALNIIGHSHGGNIAIEGIVEGLGRKVTNLVTLGTPVRSDYRLINQQATVAHWYNVFDRHDKVQLAGGSVSSGPLSGRVQAGAVNIELQQNYGPVFTHSFLHSEEAWHEIFEIIGLK